MRPVETIPGMGGEGIKENDEGMSLTTTYCKSFRKCHNKKIPIIKKGWQSDSSGRVQQAL
jgi:hypothetical protein